MFNTRNNFSGASFDYENGACRASGEFRIVDTKLFSFQINDRKIMHFSYARYLENKIREGYGFEGTSLKFVFRERKEKEQ